MWRPLPRQQGSGLVNALSAVTSEAYLTVGGNKPKVSLGDNATGEYTFSFEVHNFSGAEKRYTLSASLLTEDVTNIGGIDFMAEQDRAPQRLRHLRQGHGGCPRRRHCQCHRDGPIV